MAALRLIGLLLLWPSLILLTASFFPVGRRTENVPLPGAHTVDIEYPANLRLGDPQEIQLSLASASNNNDDYTLTASARLDSVDLKTTHPGDWEQPLLPGQSVRWRWTVTAESPGRHQANLIIHLRFIPKAGGMIEEKSVWARTLAFQAADVLGLPPFVARSLSVSGTLLSALLVTPVTQKIFIRRHS